MQGTARMAASRARCVRFRLRLRIAERQQQRHASEQADGCRAHEMYAAANIEEDNFLRPRLVRLPHRSVLQWRSSFPVTVRYRVVNPCL